MNSHLFGRWVTACIELFPLTCKTVLHFIEEVVPNTVTGLDVKFPDLSLHDLSVCISSRS